MTGRMSSALVTFLFSKINIDFDFIEKASKNIEAFFIFSCQKIVDTGKGILTDNLDSMNDAHLLIYSTQIDA